MPPAPDQDGHCGNFNGNPGDDSHDAIVGRIGTQVAKTDLIFDRYTSRIPGKKLNLDDCPPNKRAAAEQVCRSASDGLTASISNRDNEQMGSELLSGCVFDVCFAGDRYAMQDEVEGW
mmetsp:Transcript_95520/g.274015  ORF Transcript_95520/g.274015 Transcript_95520/m.274015 type:complete len:118 (+) Transcript_95520:317-670(+)